MCFVCFHNLLVDHLRPREKPRLQRKTGRKPGLGEQSGPPGLGCNQEAFTHEVRLQWKGYAGLCGHCLPVHFLPLTRVDVQGFDCSDCNENVGTNVPSSAQARHSPTQRTGELV